MSLSAPWVEQMRKAGDAGGGWTRLMRRITTETLDVGALRGRYSDGLLSVLSALLTKDASRRPALRHVLTWPVLRATEEAATVLWPRAAPKAAPAPKVPAKRFQHLRQGVGGAGGVRGMGLERLGTLGTAPSDSAAAAAAAAQLVRSWRRRSRAARSCAAATASATIVVDPIVLDPVVCPVVAGSGAAARSPNARASPIATADVAAAADTAAAADAGVAGLGALAAAGLSALPAGSDAAQAAAAALTLGRAVQRSLSGRRQRRAERRHVAGGEQTRPCVPGEPRHAQLPPPSLASPSSSPGGAMLGLPPTPRRASRREPCRLPPEERREAATEYQGQLVETRHRIPEPYVAVEATGAAEATVATVVTEATEAAEAEAAEAVVVAEAAEASEAAEATRAAEAVKAAEAAEAAEAAAAAARGDAVTRGERCPWSMLEAAPQLVEYPRREFPVQMAVHVPPTLVTAAAGAQHGAAQTAEPVKAESKRRPGLGEKVRGFSPVRYDSYHCAQKVGIVRVQEPRRLRVNTELTKKPASSAPVVALGPACRALSPCAVPLPYMCVLGQPKNTARAPPMSKRPYNVAPRRRTSA